MREYFPIVNPHRVKTHLPDDDSDLGLGSDLTSVGAGGMSLNRQTSQRFQAALNSWPTLGTPPRTVKPGEIYDSNLPKVE